MNTVEPGLLVVEAPGKVPVLRRLLRSMGITWMVLATGGHFVRHASTLYPLGITPDLREPGRRPSSSVVGRLRTFAAGRLVVVATDPDSEGEVIARDVASTVSDVALRIVRVRLTRLAPRALRGALVEAVPIEPRRAAPGDARRVLDRLLGHAFTRPGAPVGRVLSALLGHLASSDPVVGHVDLTRPAADGGAPFRVRVPVRASEVGLWRDRVQTPLAAARAGVRERAQPEPVLGYAGLLAEVAAGLARGER